jgi:hypothetical protein
VTASLYPPARTVAAHVQAHLARQFVLARARGETQLLHEPDADAIETVINAAFWASLRREEGYTPTISLALLPPSQARPPLTFEPWLSLDAAALAKLAPAVKRPGIHLGVWRAADELRVWGTTRAVPALCLVLEVVAPGLLVIKYPHGESGKFLNIAVLEGDEIKMVDERGSRVPDCPDVVSALTDFESPAARSNAGNVIVRLAVSMRAHGRGGSLLIVPAAGDAWRESIVHPIQYTVVPPFAELSALMQRDERERARPEWQDAMADAVDAAAGLTAVDGATVMTDRYDVLAFAAKIARRGENARVDQVIVTEPINGSVPSTMHPTQLGGTRHLSAAQFVHDQRDASALVASQDGRFTIFKWSPRESMVHAHRVEALLL